MKTRARPEVPVPLISLREFARRNGSALQPDVAPARLADYMYQLRAEVAGNRTINIEQAVLSCAIGYTWKALWPKLKKLEENRDVGTALEPDEEKETLDAAAGNVANPHLNVCG